MFDVGDLVSFNVQYKGIVHGVITEVNIGDGILYRIVTSDLDIIWLPGRVLTKVEGTVSDRLGIQPSLFREAEAELGCEVGELEGTF